MSAGTVITPVFGSTVTSDPSGTAHLPASSFVAVTVFLFPSLSVYVTSTVFVSASVGGVTVTLPSSFAFTVGAAGACLSAGVFALALDVSVGFDSFPALSFAFALTSVPSFTLSAGTVITPVFGSTVTSDPSGTAHLPASSFVAVTVFLFPSLSVYVTSTVFVSASVGGVTVTLPSSFAFTVGAAGAVVFVPSTPFIV